MNRTYDTNYILNDIYIHGDGTVRLRRFDNNFIFNAIYDPETGGLRVNKIVGMTANDLEDFVITSPTNGQVLTYDAATGKWVNGIAIGAGARGRVRLTYTIPGTTTYFIIPPMIKPGV